MSKRLLPAVLVVGLVLAACGGDDPVVTKSSESTTSTIVAATTLPPDTTTRAATSSSSEAPATSVPPPIRVDDDGGVIVFSSNRDGNEEIYVMNADGSGQQRLTNNPAYDHLPNWSPDGERIVFTADRDADFETYVMDADGGNPRSLGGGGWSIWSTDGSQIAFMVSSDGDSEIFVMPAPQDGASVGGDPRRLTSNDSHDWEPAWSPDGSQIAFVSDRDGNAEIYIMDADGSDQRRLTDNQTDEWHPAWSPDGAQIAFMSDRNDPDPIGCRPDCNYDLFVLTLGESLQGPDSGWQQVTDHVASDHHPAWSPDGSRLAFYSSRDGDAEIYTLSVADSLLAGRGSDIRQLTNNEFDDSSPAWRPDQTRPTFGLIVPVPTGQPVVDGQFAVGEWDGALSAEMTNGGELMLMHSEGYLYLGIRSRAMGFGSVCKREAERVSILHSSAGLGTAIFEQDGTDWRRTRQFSYCCWGAIQDALDEFLETEGWVASVGTRGPADEMEYQIRMDDGELTLAVVYVDDLSFRSALHWPRALNDDCLGLALTPEDPPERLRFVPETWITVTATTD
jgi:dipeptidyl aminopeptidase/acylaminoacyl peptidase